MGVQVPLPAPLKNQVELWFNLLININSRNGIDFCCVKERDDLMVKIIKEEIEIGESLGSRLRVICDFCNTTPTIINRSIRRIDKTNLTYIELHRIYIKSNLYLAFNYSSEIYVNNLGKKNKLSELEDYIKQS